MPARISSQDRCIAKGRRSEADSFAIMNEPATPLSQAELDRFASYWNKGRILRHFGFELSLPGAERAVVELHHVRAEHRGGMGSDAINGGVLAAMIDLAVGCSALLAPPLRRSATVELNMQFQRGVRGPGARCEAVIDRATQSLLFVSGLIMDRAGVVCARCSGLVSLGKPITLDAWMAALADAPDPKS